MTEDLLLTLFALTAVACGALMIVLRHPMQVALALIAAMLSLGVVYGALGVHVIAVFQIMVYVIMLLDVRDPSFRERFSRLLWPGLIASALLVAALVGAAWSGALPGGKPGTANFGVQPFSITFLGEYWLYFELTSVLLVVAVLAAVAVVKLRSPRHG